MMLRLPLCPGKGGGITKHLSTSSMVPLDLINREKNYHIYVMLNERKLDQIIDALPGESHHQYKSSEKHIKQ